MWKTQFSSHKHYLFGLLFSRNAKKTHTDQSILLTFLLCLKKNVSLTLKSSGCKKVFRKCVYHGYNLLRWMFLIPCDNWKTFLLIQTYRYPEVWCNRHVAAFLETSILKKVLIHIHYFHNNITMLLIPQYSYFLHVPNKIYFLIAILSVCECSIWIFHIFYKWNFQNLKVQKLYRGMFLIKGTLMQI